MKNNMSPVWVEIENNGSLSDEEHQSLVDFKLPECAQVSDAEYRARK